MCIFRKFDTIPLASKGWDHRRSNGDYFIINSHGRNPSLLSGDDFNEMGLEKCVLEELLEMGHTCPTVIQKKAIKHVFKGNNCLIAAETGSGKTLSYLIPLIQNIYLEKEASRGNAYLNTPRAVVVTPGRELSEQITKVCNQLTKNMSIVTHHVTGGQMRKKMLDPAVGEVDILIGTFGALSKLTTTKVYDISKVRTLVLDEADTLLDDSFNTKLVHFLKRFDLQITEPQNGPEGVQMILVSATMPRSVEGILGDVIPFETFTKITTDYLHRILPHVPQKFVRLSYLDKPAKLLELVKKDVSRKLPVTVFSNRAERCDWVSMLLNENGVPCINLNADMNRHLREGRFQQFVDGKCLVLSCTDVVSRGLDTVNNHHVINYDVPMNVSDYVHRCGRVGRVGSSSGIVTTLVCHPTEAELVQKIEFAARKMSDDLPNVNANVKRLLASKELRYAENQLKGMY